ncbi:hypothetical protein MC885_017101 [Smutsia gigantea]|nr:hypothetical protein MC885_017101 [Smutsia gigantea]
MVCTCLKGKPLKGPEPSIQCELSPVNASHPVQALMESFTVLSGCASRGTMGLPQEVHVLNLRAADQRPGQPEREDDIPGNTGIKMAVLCNLRKKPRGAAPYAVQAAS